MTLKERIKLFAAPPFVRDSMILQVGALCTTGVAGVASIAIARLLGAENYGLYPLVSALVGLLTVFTNSGADYAGVTLWSNFLPCPRPSLGKVSLHALSAVLWICQRPYRKDVYPYG